LVGHSGFTPKKPFHFENFWLTHPDFQENAPTWWKNVEVSHGTLMYRFQQKLKNFKQHLRNWNKMVFGNIFQAQKELEQKMQEIQKQIILRGRSDQLQVEEANICKQLDEQYAQEEQLWHQKS
jgi:hypothetical protein